MASSNSSLSQRASSPDNPKTSRDLLISHIVAAKRSLNLTHPSVIRASEIVTDARSSLEDSAILSARARFLSRSLESQLRILRAVQFEVEDASHKTQSEFGTVLKSLDAADARLRDTIENLRSTTVESGFRPEEEQQRTLLDFVDEKPVGELHDALKESIAEIQRAKREMDGSNATFEEDLNSINDILGEKTTGSATSESEDNPPTPQSLLHGIEDHAKEVAESLESLVKHYDLCVTAIRHTEGGGAAMQGIDNDLPDSVDVDRPDLSAPAQPLSPAERKEMLTVLDNDALEVEDVVAEIQDRIVEMEIQLNQINAIKERKEARYDQTIRAFSMTEVLGRRLPSYIAQSQSFLSRWHDQQSKIEEGMSNLEALHEVYDNYLYAYDGLLVEVARRRAVRNQMERIIADAETKLQELHDTDMEAREAFKVKKGDFLPSDIWPGLEEPPMRIEIERVENEGRSLPCLRRSIVETAMRRLKKAEQA